MGDKFSEKSSVAGKCTDCTRHMSVCMPGTAKLQQAHIRPGLHSKLAGVPVPAVQDLDHSDTSLAMGSFLPPCCRDLEPFRQGTLLIKKVLHGRASPGVPLRGSKGFCWMLCSTSAPQHGSIATHNKSPMLSLVHSSASLSFYIQHAVRVPTKGCLRVLLHVSGQSCPTTGALCPR